MFSLDVIVSWAKRRGFVYPGSDIYGGLANAWDYGPYGIQLKKNIQDLRWKTFVQKRPDMIGLDAQILMHPRTWEASGHTANFDDPLIDDKNTGERFRADKIIEDVISMKREECQKKISNFSIDDEVLFYEFTLEIEYERVFNNVHSLMEGVFNDFFNSNKYIVAGVNYDYMGISDLNDISDLNIKLNISFYTLKSFNTPIEIPVTLNFSNNMSIKEINHTITKVDIGSQLGLRKSYIVNLLVRKEQKEKGILLKNLIPESRTFDQMKAFIVTEIPYNPNDKKKKKPAEWTDVRKFQMMFYTHQGVIHDDENKIWMRPETAQGIFVNFRNVLDTTRMRVPFGIGQVGKAFRNEITPGNFLYRTREFEQMEIEYFVEDNDETAAEHYQQWQQQSMQFWLETLKLTEANLRFREHEADELSHYSKGTFDVEFKYPWGWGELQGIAWRGNFDLMQHQEHSGKSMQYSDPYTGDRYIPQVIEPSFGLSRTVLAVMFDCYDEETYTDGKGNEQTRVVTRFPEAIAPVKYAILPLIKKDKEQVRIAKDLYTRLSESAIVEYDDGGAIGKRYRRQDEIGTPWCITVDHTSVEDGTVTLRNRGTMEQSRVAVEDIV